MPRAANPVPKVPTPCPYLHRLFVGTSGWAYPSWKPAFYPERTPPRAFLAFYSSHLSSVEVNYTFRTLPKAAQLESWLAAVPPGFRFSCKAPQRVTHVARLRACEDPLENFLQALEPAHRAGKLGPVLFQLPPNFVANRERLVSFLEGEALRRRPALQVAFEFRHPSWFDEEVFRVLRDANAALCVAESEDLRTPDVRTANFSYYRLRCPGGYTGAKLKVMAARLRSLRAEGEVFVYLKHEDEPTGALNARALLKHISRADAAAQKNAKPGTQENIKSSVRG